MPSAISSQIHSLCRLSLYLLFDKSYSSLCSRTSSISFSVSTVNLENVLPNTYTLEVNLPATCSVLSCRLPGITRQRQVQTGKIFFSSNSNDTVFVCLCRYLSVTGWCEFERVETVQEYFVVSCRAL